MSDVLVRAKNLTVQYNGVTALRGASFDVQRGEFIGCVGLSGSGKTTLLNALAGFISSDGAVEIRGTLGIVFQDHAVFPWMTVVENIGFGLDHRNRTEKQAIVGELLRRVGMEQYANRYPAELSGGQVQRVGLARALASDPDVVLMDEPYGALDRHTRDRMQAWLLEVWAEDKKTVLFVTHDIEEAVFLSDRLLIVADGRITREMLIPFPRPRPDELKFTSEFTSLKKQVFETMCE